MLDLNKIEEKLLNEEIDPLEMWGVLKDHEKTFKKVLELCKDQAIKESHLHPKNFDNKGYSFEKRNGKANYSYKHISEWVDITNEKSKLEEKLKTALKSHELGIDSVDENGVVLELPIVTYSADVLVVKKTK